MNDITRPDRKTGTVKVLREGRLPGMKDDKITSDDARDLPPGCVIIPGYAVDPPEPVKPARKAR